ncbi:DUF916 and DUF3324 domain-containing protein [Alloiococcus otitis]|uniref:DUF916 and DUF3324 domain-containing protein n=1 Tax=Alloiococcus otitis TaxID=1652 RepID=UPI002355D406|nr:DUF916 and DUF3324 domain-containing protein [Alloiococcus otitis]
MKKKILSLLLVLSSLFALFATTVHGQDEGQAVPYSVQALLPDNQVNDQVSYFDIEMEPGASQALEVDVFNSSSEEIKVAVETNFGASNSNGIITYDGTIEEYDDSMEAPFDEISRVYEEEITIAPEDSKRAIIDVDIPEEGFNGQILGGIFFRLIDDEENDGQAEGEEEAGLGFENEYAYAVGVNIVQADPEEDGDQDQAWADKKSVEEIDPELELNWVETDLINYQTGVDAEFANKTPVLIEDINFHAYVTQAGSEDVLYEREVENFAIGPNNVFKFPVTFNQEALQPGDYTYHANLSNDEEDWEFSQDFTITEVQSEELNEQAVEIDDGWNWTAIAIGAIALVIILILVIAFLLRKLQTK